VKQIAAAHACRFALAWRNRELIFYGRLKRERESLHQRSIMYEKSRSPLQSAEKLIKITSAHEKILIFAKRRQYDAMPPRKNACAGACRKTSLLVGPIPYADPPPPRP
jgi:hypothetical protein